MTLENEFEKISEKVIALSKFEDLLSSCAELMARSLVNDGKIINVGAGLGQSPAEMFTDLLVLNTDAARPALPALFIAGRKNVAAQIEALGIAGDFAIFFECVGFQSETERCLDICLERSITSVIICPDISTIQTTDKGLEIRIEYGSAANYLFGLVAICNYLTKSIEHHLFGSHT